MIYIDKFNEQCFNKIVLYDKREIYLHGVQCACTNNKCRYYILSNIIVYIVIILNI